MWFRNASAIWLRALLCTQMNRTFFFITTKHDPANSHIQVPTRIADDCRDCDDSGRDLIKQSRTLYCARRSVIEYRRMRPTNRHSQSDSHSAHIYEIRPRMDQRCVDLISDALPFGRLWCGDPNAVSNATGYAKSTVDHVMP